MSARAEGEAMSDKFWRDMRKAASANEGQPDHAKAGINLSEQHYETFRSKCRRCAECVGQDHHWLPVPEEDSDWFFPCKHCDARAPVCEDCGDEIATVSGILCAACDAIDSDKKAGAP